MKRTLTILVLLAVAALVTAPADAGLFKKDKHKKAPEPAKTWRYDRLPTMAFAKGELRDEGQGQWKLGKLDLQLGPKCEILGQDGPANLQTGRTAVVMGPQTGNTIVAWRVVMQKQMPRQRSLDQDVKIEWSESNPNVGKGTAPN